VNKRMTDSKVLQQLEHIVGKENITTSPVDLYAYSSDASIYRCSPDAVVRPETVDDLVSIVKLANETKTIIIARGGGSALCGHSTPIRGGIIIDMQSWNKVKGIHVEDLYCVVEPGVIYNQLNDALSPYGFFFPPAPGSGEVATIGGMVITNASGVNAVKYGATRDYVMGLQVVLPTGESVKMGNPTLKEAAGYQLARLMVGSEGTLGIVTEVTLKVAPIPEKKAGAVAAFEDLMNAGKCVSNIISSPLIPSALEIMDDICIKAINNATNLNLPDVDGLLLIEVDGDPEAVGKQIKKVADICKESGAASVEHTDDTARLHDLMKARKAMIPSLARYKEGMVTVMLADDMAVPMSKIPESIKRFHEIAEKYDIYIPTYGHAGDGNLHTKIIIDPKSTRAWKRAEKATREIFDVVLGLGGTVTGEHGVGIAKAPFMQKERQTLLSTMKKIKKALDPNNILNPGKQMDWEGSIITDLRYETEPKKLNHKAVNLRKWEDELNACTYCGYCKSVCPVFDELKWDTALAKGHINTSYGLLQGDLEIDEGVKKRLFQCSLCLDCYRRCPTKVKIPEIVEAARADIVSQGYSFEDHIVIKDNVMENGDIFSADKYPSKEGELLVFLGCNYAQRPNKVKIFFRLLEKLGYNPKVAEEICCGYPLKMIGFLEDFEKHKKKFRKLYPYDNFTVLCPSCNMFLNEEFDLKVTNMIELVNRGISKMDNIPMQNGIVTYHDPCHLARSLDVIDQPRQSIEKLGFTFREMKQNKEMTRCCGGGGGVSTADPELADKMAENRIKQATDAEADLLLTLCPNCELTLRKAASKTRDKKPKVKNLYEVIWRAIKEGT
jgi:glycolate oxidase